VDILVIKYFLSFALGLIMISVLYSCEKRTDMLKTATVTLPLNPSSLKIQGEHFILQLSDLKIIRTIDVASNEFITTPSLKGTIRIKNHSDDILDVQGVTFLYLDQSGNPILFITGEKDVTVTTYLKNLQPGKESENQLDVNIPRAAVRDRSLSKIQVSLVYVPIPLKREILDFPTKIGEKLISSSSNS
jgi:hypothetical protein